MSAGSDAWARLSVQRRDGQRRNPLPAAHEADPLARRELHVHHAGVHTRRLRQAGTHLVTEWVELWLLTDDGGVDVRRRVTGVGELLAHGAQKTERVGVTPALVGVGKVLADVAEAGRSEQRVDDGVGQDVGVAVAGEPGFGLLDLHAAEDQAATGRQAVGVEADAGAQLRSHPIGSSRRPRSSNTASSFTPRSLSHSTARSYSYPSCSGVCASLDR